MDNLVSQLFRVGKGGQTDVSSSNHITASATIYEAAEDRRY